jgi:hypothetical protein
MMPVDRRMNEPLQHLKEQDKKGESYSGTVPALTYQSLENQRCLILLHFPQQIYSVSASKDEILMSQEGVSAY